MIEIDSTQIKTNWRLWAIKAKLLKIPDGHIIEILKSHGIDQDAATEGLTSVTSLFLRSSVELVRKQSKLESLLATYASLAALRRDHAEIERRSGLSLQEFLNEYYIANRPVVLLGLMEEWKAFRSWSPQYLKSKYGTLAVEIMNGRDSDPDYEVNMLEHKSTIPLADYIDLIEGASTNDCYLVANNRLLEREGFKTLLEDMVPLPEYLDSGTLVGQCFLWLGPKGTVTPLHYDLANNLLAQVYGRKHITLIPSYDLPYVYNDISVHSRVDCENIDYNQHPRFKHVNVVDFTLEAGEVLFLPVAWWHHVRALSASINVSFTNFVFPNYYPRLAGPFI